MFFSYKKLKAIANLAATTTVAEVTEAMTSIGFEVEGFKKFSNLEGLKFGKVLKNYKNPNGDKLNVCEIQFADQQRIIQTTATGVKVNSIVLAFVPGSKAGKTVFGAKTMKGIVSEGMLSSLPEFGIDVELVRPENDDGISAYNEVTDLTIDPINYLDLDDYIIDVDILSNRSDAASYYVMAHELAAYFKTKVKLPHLKTGKLPTKIKVKNNKLSSIVALEAQKDFVISTKDQIFLAKHNIKSINDVADLSNLTLLYTGQPTHIYDGAKVGRTIEAKHYSGKVNILGNKEVTLENALVVHIDNKPQCVASVVGLESSSSTILTKNLIIELGIFNINEVRRAAKNVRLSTESAAQGGKKLAPGTTELALRFLSSRLDNFSKFINFQTPSKKAIPFVTEMVNQIAGFEITKTKAYKGVMKALITLGFEFKEAEVLVPSYRHDLHTSQDLVEEIFRFYGYHNFEPMAPTLNASPINQVLNVSTEVAAQGYQEVRTYALTSEQKNIINPFNFAQNVKLATFVSKEREVIRNSQVVSILEIMDHNYKRGIKDLSLFSLGMINYGVKTLILASNVKTFQAMQQDIINLIPNATFKATAIKNTHPGMTADIEVNKQQVGWIGKLHPAITTGDFYVAELKVEALEANQAIVFQEYKDIPLKYEDITYELSSKAELASKLGSLKNVFSVKVIDEYQDKNSLKVTVRIVK